ncbi:MAG: DUF4011 domain-containing protein [Clostridia bacterium]|nr:DUF4011 domain-containing protein [Clostridia bacterium]
MNKSIIDKWSDMLLDTGKRNNLINFKDTRSSTVEIVCPDIDLLFEKFCSSDSLEIYDISRNIKPDDTKESEEKPKKLSKEKYLEEYKGFLNRSNQVLVYNAVHRDPAVALKSIDKRSRDMLEETGINSTHAAFGFIKWSENENSNEYYKAPILLVPITLVNDSAVEPYKICINEDEVIVNPILNFKLSNEYGITLPEYNGGTFEEYLSKIENSISKLKWSILKECKVGIFSFEKLNMYCDLKENVEKILENDNVKIILGEKCNTNEIYMEDNEGNENLLVDLTTVVDADSSQLDAIKMVKSGRSFVLKGPPGTGKSQTITNIISQCLYDDKKVLFVSEKLSALNVVYDKIKKLGLEEFCLELHSHKSNKKEVIKELCNTMYLGAKDVLQKNIDNEIAEKVKAQRRLDEYEKELHKTRSDIDKSLYELYDYYFKIKYNIEDLFPIPGTDFYGSEDINKISDLLEQYVNYVPVLGYNYKNNEWYGYINQDNSAILKRNLKSKMTDMIGSVKALSDISAKIYSEYGIKCNSPVSMLTYKEFFEWIKDVSFITPIFFDKNEFGKAIKKIEKLKSLVDETLSIKSKLDGIFNSTIYEVNGKECQGELISKYSGLTHRLFNGEYKAFILNLRTYTKDNRKIKYSDALNYMKLLSDYQQNIAEYNVLEEDIKNELGSGYSGFDSDWNKFLGEIDYLKKLHDNNFDFGNFINMPKSKFESTQNYLKSIFDVWIKHSNIIAESSEYISKCFDKEIFDIKNEDNDKIVAKLEDCLNNYEKLDSWYYFKDLISKLKENDVLSILDYLLEHNIEPDQIVNVFKKCVYKSWIESIISGSPILAQFTRVNQEQAIKTFSEKDKLNFSINIARIKSKLSKNRPKLGYVAPGSAVSILQREEQKKRNVKSVKRLMDEIGDFIQALKPCFLMSPMSVSTFLRTSDVTFDVIIFDEASQIFPQDAIGSIYRGKQLIVVGDPKQMPPTNFFNTTLEVEYETENVEENNNIQDYDSILDLCLSSFPYKELNWHYRSKSEELIAFSNKNFYRNNLITFPSVWQNAKWFGIDYHYVWGTFDNRSNLKEANYIVDLIYENIEKFPKRSLGVVAFSVAQQDLIEKMLYERRKKELAKEWFFSQSKKEPFFVKNLETVQGDERDTIIFSIAYAKNIEGRLLHRFGPLSNKGGERRLNVAVTRAKYNIQVVTSLHAHDIDLTKATSEGARLLREYIDFAENGIEALNSQLSVNNKEKFDSDFEVEVYDFLKDNGFNIDTQVGCSGFKIDLALKTSNNSEYILAIECDGATYHSSRNARDRDRLRQEILESMGWKFYRIWSTDWFKNNREEKERLLKVVETALQDHTRRQEYSNSEEQQICGGLSGTEEWTIPCADAPKIEFPKYELADVNKLYSENYLDFKQFVKSVLEIEAPLSEEWFLKRISSFFGREKVTKPVISEYSNRMLGCFEYGIIREHGFIFLRGKEIKFRVRGDIPRKIHDISPEELSVGMIDVIEKSVSIGKEDLYRAIIKLQGISKITTAIRKKLDEAFSIIDKKVNYSSNDRLTLKKYLKIKSLS